MPSQHEQVLESPRTYRPRLVTILKHMQLAAVVPKGVVRSAAMEDTGFRGSVYEAGNEADSFPSPSSSVRWVAPVDPITGQADTRLCFLYADMWRRVLDPRREDLAPLVGVGVTVGLGSGYAEEVAPEVYDAVLSSVMSIVKKLDLRYETSDEGGR